MDVEARSLPPSVKTTLLVKLREFKSDLNNFKSELKTITTSANLNAAAAARDDLLEAGLADTKTVCNKDKLTSIIIISIFATLNILLI